MRQLTLAVLFLTAPILSLAQQSEPCPRFNPGSVLSQQQDLYGVRGRLEVTLIYNTSR